MSEPFNRVSKSLFCDDGKGVVCVYTNNASEQQQTSSLTLYCMMLYSNDIGQREA